MRWICSLLFLLFSTLCRAQTEEEVISNFAEDTSTRFLTKELLIGGLVSPISGQLVLSDTDLIAQGREPITLKRIYQPPYIPDEKHSNPYYESWSFVPQRLLEVHQNDKVRIRDANGGTLDFIVTDHSCNLITNRKGLCNVIAETPSGMYEPANTRIHFAEDKKTVNVLDPCGIKRIYKRYTKQSGITFYLLEKEILSNGRVVRYDYKRDVLSKITSLDPHEEHVYAAVDFVYETDTRLVCTTDRGKKATYHFENAQQGPSLLTHISSPSYRDTRIDYSKTYLLRMEEGKQRNYLGIYKGFPSLHSSSYFRVHELCFPSGEKDALETVYTIDYTPAIAGTRTGLTVAKRKDGSSIHYHIGKNLLVEKIEFYDKERKLRKQNIYTWQEPGSLFLPNRSHWLKSCETQDENGSLLIKKTFHCDVFGNVERELLQGDLTGDGTIDTLTTRRTFSKEGRHLLLSEEIEGKTLTTYTYLLGTNLPTSKVLRDKEKIRQRTFWEYDNCNNLIKKILDDGSREKKEDLTDVTERRILCYTLKTQAPHLHLPCSIEDRYLEDNEEKLLKTTYFEYDLDDNITLERCEDSEGKVLYTREKIYDEQGNVLSETNPLGHTAISTYTPKGQLQTYTDFSGRLREERDYDKKGRLKECRKIADTGITHTTRHHYDGCDHLKESQDHLGHNTIYEYDPVTNKAIRIEEPPVGKEPVIHENIYNAAGDKISYTDPCSHTTKYRHNVYGVTDADYPDASPEHWRYDKHGRLTKHVDQGGVETSYTHDYADRTLTKTISFQGKQESLEIFTYNAFHLLEKKDPEEIITSYIYDKAGRKIQQTKQDRVLVWEYDPLNRITTFREENGDNTRLTHFLRDATGKILEKTVTDKHNHLLSRISYSYDPQQRLTSITRYPEEGEITEKYAYDAFSRPIVHEDASGSISTTLYVDDATPYTIEQDALGIKTKKTFDAHHNLILKEQFDLLGILLQKEEKNYDPCSRLTKHREEIYHQGVFIRDEIIRYTYTPCGELETLTIAADTDKAGTTKYTYTPSGLLSTKTLPDNTSLTYGYTSLGYLNTLISSDGSIFHTFNCNKRGDLLEAIDNIQDIKVTRVPDAFGNILEESLSTGLKIIKTYDHFDRPLSLTLPGDSQIIYLYDALRLRATHRTTLTGEYTHNYLDYDLAGNLLAEKMVGDLGVITHTTRIKEQKKSKSSPFFSEECSYNARGELLTSTKNGVESGYAHDPLSHLIAEPGYTYQVDSLHNLLEKNGIPAQINSLNQLEALGSVTCLYNDNGDLIEKASEHGKVTYAYNPLHELISATQESTCIQFTQDPLGRILKRVKSSPTGTETELYLYDGNEEIGAFNENGTCKNLRILGFGKEPVAIELDGEVFAPITDMHRNVEMLIAYPSGTITHTYRYSAFGEPFPTQETLFNPWRFSGKRIDPDLGIVSFGKRFYDPELIRWLTIDPAGFTDSINLYQYVLHNPFRYLDPHGESLLGYLCGIAQILAGGIVMATGIALECATFGGYTFALGFHEAAGLALMTSGCAQAMSNAKDVSFLNRYQWQHTLFEGIKESGVATEQEEEKKKPPFDGSELGNDPTKCPSEGFEWKGKGSPESGKGNWVKKKDGIVESLHPDFKHPPPIPPHWDYIGPGFEEGVRLYLDGNWGPK